MKNKKNLLIIILARKGSKRLRNKNLKLMGKKSITENTILFSKKIISGKNIIVSTDSKKIREIAIRNRVICPWLRPKNLSLANSSSGKTAIHALKWYEKNYTKIKNILLLQPTTPFRDIKLFINAIKFFEKDSKYPIVSVCEYKKKIKDFVIIKKNIASYFIKKKIKEKIYKVNGSMYIIKADDLKKNKNFTQKKFRPVIMNNYKENIDIDNQQDLNIARAFLKLR